jgi:hypothetical protein
MLLARVKTISGEARRPVNTAVQAEATWNQ